MPNTRDGGTEEDELSAEGRASTVFYETDRYQASLQGLGKSNVPAIRAAVLAFQQAWRVSATNADLPPGFRFKPLNGLRGQYRLWQIYVGRDYRAALLFPSAADRTDVYLVHVWRKTKQNNKSQVDLAKSRAQRLWDELQ